MYCVNCGVKLAPTQQECPLCNFRVGDVPKREMEAPLYPSDRLPERKLNKGAVNGVVLMLWLIPLFVTLFIDLRGNGKLLWSWYVMGALALLYVVVALPGWFEKPNPVIFVPCDFAAVALYLMRIAGLTEGHWFLSFARPVVGFLGLVVTAVVTLIRYLKKGRLYIIGGALIALGIATIQAEWLMMLTFSYGFVGWSMYPLIPLVMLGGMLIFLGINKTARERMERRFFF